VPKPRHVLTGLTLAVVLPAATWSQAPPRPAPPKLEPVAETRLLMEGLAQPNFKAIDRLLQEEPADADAWQFARGQSLLIAETANLLLLRPPKAAKAEEAWMARATDLRDRATALARSAATRDAARTRAALGAVATSCNRCHETFRVEVKVTVTDRAK
jgi:hypothetical protein